MNWRALANPGFLAAFLTLAAAGLGMQAAISHYQIYLQKKPIHPEPINDEERILRALPVETEHWRREGQDRIESPEMLEELGTSNYLTRTYVEKEGQGGKRPRRVELHVAYYTGMIDTVPHVPERCFTGGGMALIAGPWTVPVTVRTDDWLPVAAEENPFHPRSLYTTRLSNQYSTAGGGRRVNLPTGIDPDTPLPLRVTEYSSGGSGNFFAGYFFIANGGAVPSSEHVRELAFDLKNDYAYYLKVQFGSPDASSPEELAALAGLLLNDLLGELMTCVPDWSKVHRGLWPPDNPKAQTQTASQP
jgi:hypothetical protein